MTSMRSDCAGYAIYDMSRTPSAADPFPVAAMTGVPQPTAVSTTLLTQRVRTPENQSRLVGDLRDFEAKELATYAIG
jgi:hypothetical protein